jgi:uncharacterized surface protein with fasciclin (FAS1) repeats
MNKLFKVICLGLSIMIIGTFPLAGAAKNLNGDLNTINRIEMPKEDNDRQNIVNTAAEQENLFTLIMLLNTSGLNEALKAEGPFTVFAPNDQAFGALGEEKLESLLTPGNAEKLKSILSYHVVPKKLTGEEITEDMKVKTLQGEELSITVENGKIMVNGAAVVDSDIEAKNGVIHVIDKVLIPSNDKE